MRKRTITIFALCAITAVTFLFTGCSVENLQSEKLRDIDFTVIDEEDIPSEFKEMIEDKEKEPFKLTYADNGILYIGEGYGEQQTSGYSIEVKELYESKNAIYIHTNLIGPSNDERIVERKTYPYIVVKLEFIDKNVVFQ